MADQGFKQLATYAHQRGLLFGIHVMRGINEIAIQQNVSVCGTNTSISEIYLEEMECNFSFQASKFYSVNLSHPAGQAFIDTLYAQYAEWGVDFIKQDCVLDGDWDYDSILAASTGIDHSGRPMLLSLSGGGTDDLYHASVVADLASMYRVTLRRVGPLADQHTAALPDSPRAGGLHRLPDGPLRLAELPRPGHAAIRLHQC